MPSWGQLPIWVIAVVVILKVVFDFLKEWRGKRGEGASAEEKKLAVILKKLDPMEQQLRAVHDLVSRKDDDGAPLIYTRRSMEEALKALSVVLADVKIVLADIHNENRRQTEILKAIVDEQHRQAQQLTRLTLEIPCMRAGSNPGG